MARVLKVPSSFFSGKMGEDEKAIWLWKAKWSGHEIPIGAELILPLEPQEFRFSKIMVWGKRAGSKRREVTFSFESNCVVCSDPYTFRVPTYFRSVVRTCTRHRRQWRQVKPGRRTRDPNAPKTARKPRDHTAPETWGIVQEEAFMAHHTLYQSTYDLDKILSNALAALAARGKICTKGNVLRAYRKMQQYGHIDSEAEIAERFDGIDEGDDLL